MYTLWADKWFYLTGIGLLASLGLLLYLLQQFKDTSEEGSELEQFPEEESPELEEEEKFDEEEEPRPSPQLHFPHVEETLKDFQGRLDAFSKQLDKIQYQLNIVLEKLQDTAQPQKTEEPSSKKTPIFPI
ncbi:MAG: hypothetical protein HY400_05265 [Elusimicrobia bacterium]|nr:hypothetical protein [Elusimicrobiota bacterium]